MELSQKITGLVAMVAQERPATAVSFCADITSAFEMNGGAPVLGRATRALLNDTSPLFPVRFLYYPQLFPLVEAPNDGLPIILDDEVRYHGDLAGEDPAKLHALMAEYAGVVAEVKAMTPNCPLSVYGILPNSYLIGKFGQAWLDARKLLTDQMDFVYIDFGDGSVGDDLFASQLPDIAAMREEFPHLPIMVKVCPSNMTDETFTQRLRTLAATPGVSQINIWVSIGSTWPDSTVDAQQFPPDLTGNYAQIAKQVARDHPGGRPIVKKMVLRD